MIEQTKAKPPETLGFELNKQMETFSFSPPKIPSEEGKWLLRVTSFGALNSVFKMTDENNSFSITTPGQWSSGGVAETINKLQKFLEFRSQNDIKLHVGEVRKRGNQTEKGDKECDLSDLYTHKTEVIKEIRNLEINNLEDFVFRFQLTYHKFAEIRDTKYTRTTSIGYTLLKRIFEISDLNLVLKCLPPENVKVSVTIDDFRLKYNLNTNETKSSLSCFLRHNIGFFSIFFRSTSWY